MDLDNINGFSLRGLSKKNVILGKNGCGKSYLLKQLDQHLVGRPGMGKIRYLSPERGGLLRFQWDIEQNIENDQNWITGERRRNQASNFRQQSVTLFRRLQNLVLHEIEREHTRPGYVPRTFDTTVEKLNTLLDRVKLKREIDKAFKILNRDTGNEATPDGISSGESELISLGIEFLAFVKECQAERENVLLVDEPDVHLHPDLQDRLAQFIVDVLNNEPITLILATHSTALLSALAEREETRVSFMRQGNMLLTFKAVSDVDKLILPIFGAHPLSNVFNQAPVFLVDGEDDERIWQQAIRSANGRLRLFPRDVRGAARFAEFEREVNNIIDAVYDNAKGYSLRDRDLSPELIDDVGNIARMRLSCRAAENLMLTNEVFALAGTNWPAYEGKLRNWAQVNQGHQYYDHVQRFINGGLDRKAHDLSVCPESY